MFHPFSAVPYETLTVSSMMNLYYNNLVIEDINILKGCGIHLKTKNTNVLVASWIPSLQDVLKKLLLTRIIFLIILKEDIYIYFFFFWRSSRFVDEKNIFRDRHSQLYHICNCKGIQNHNSWYVHRIEMQVDPVLVINCNLKINFTMLEAPCGSFNNFQKISMVNLIQIWKYLL